MSRDRLHFLDELERRLRVRLPPSYRAAFASGRVLAGIDGWELHTPDECHRCKTSDWEEMRSLRGVVVGVDAGGNALLFLFKPGSRKVLEDTVWEWNHGGELRKLASSFDDMFTPNKLETVANVILGVPDEDFDEDAKWRDSDADQGGTCRHCQSGMRGKSRCPVCDRTQEPELEGSLGERVSTELQAKDKAKRAARTALVQQLVEKLVNEGLLEPATPTSLPAIVRVADRILWTRYSSKRKASELLACWDQEPSIAELFIDEAVLFAKLGEAGF